MPQGGDKMKQIAFALLIFITFVGTVFASSAVFRDGVAIGTPEDPSSPSCTVVSTVPSPVGDYSMGLTWDGEYLWVSDAFTGELYQYDFDSQTIVSSCNGLDNSLRDLTWQAMDDGGGYLWAGTWSQYGHVNKIDVANCQIVGGFNIPGMGSNHCNGAAWNYFNDGDEWRYELILGEEGGDLYWADPSTGAIDQSCSPYSPFFDPRGLAWDGFGVWAGYQDSDEVRLYDTNCSQMGICSSTTVFQQGTAWDGHYLYTTGSSNTIAKVDVGYELTVNIAQQGITVPAGGVAPLDLEIMNHTSGVLSTDAWIDAYLTNGNQFGGSPLLFASLNIPGDAMISRTIGVSVPAVTPPGNYLLAAGVSANNNYPELTHVDHVRVTVTSPLGSVTNDRSHFSREQLVGVAPFVLVLH
jgi:hypothetical protein